MILIIFSGTENARSTLRLLEICVDEDGVVSLFADDFNRQNFLIDRSVVMILFNS